MIPMHPSPGILLLQNILPLVSQKLESYSHHSASPVLVRAMPNGYQDAVLFTRFVQHGSVARHFHAWVMYDPKAGGSLQPIIHVWLAVNDFDRHQHEFSIQHHGDDVTQQLNAGASRYDVSFGQYDAVAGLVSAFMIDGVKPANPSYVKEPQQFGAGGFGFGAFPPFPVNGSVSDIDDFFERNVLPQIVSMIVMEEAMENRNRPMGKRPPMTPPPKPKADVIYGDFDRVIMPEGMSMEFKF